MKENERLLRKKWDRRFYANRLKLRQLFSTRAASISRRHFILLFGSSLTRSRARLNRLRYQSRAAARRTRLTEVKQPKCLLIELCAASASMISARGAGCVVSTLEFFEHQLSKMGHRDLLVTAPYRDSARAADHHQL